MPILTQPKWSSTPNPIPFTSSKKCRKPKITTPTCHILPLVAFSLAIKLWARERRCILWWDLVLFLCWLRFWIQGIVFKGWNGNSRSLNRSNLLKCLARKKQATVPAVKRILIASHVHLNLEDKMWIGSRNTTAWSK